MAYLTEIVMFKRWFPLMEGDGGGSGSGAAALTEARLQQIERLIERLGKGDERSTIDKLLDEAAEARKRIRDLETAQPPNGAVILTGDDAQRWQQYTDLGTPDELTTIKQERDTFATDLRQSRRAAAIREAASAEGLNADKLDKLLPRLLAEDASIEVREVKDGDKMTKQAFVSHGDTTTRLIELDGVADVLDALKIEPQGTAFPVRQASSGQGGTPDPVQQFIEQRDQQQQQRPNPLIRAT